jgi:hypothetical protein
MTTFDNFFLTCNFIAVQNNFQSVGSLKVLKMLHIRSFDHYRRHNI